MACFLVPTGETVVVKAVEKAVEKREQNAGKEREKDEFRIPLSRKLNWLNYMLWGGVILLAFEHIWHGEVTPWFPFLTAMSDPQDASEMFHEMATVGVSMSVLVTGSDVCGSGCCCEACEGSTRDADHVSRRNRA